MKTKPLVTIIGRGHSGTRAMSHTLSASGVFMGAPLNASGDLLPPEAMYAACRILAPHVKWKGGLEWDFSRLSDQPVPAEFRTLIETYLASVLNSPAEQRGWKIPETTLVYPWILRMFPQAKYIFWIRNPRDCVIGAHITDNLHDFGVEYPETADDRLRRAISWKYQYDLVKVSPRAAQWIEVRFEDFVLHQEATLRRLEKFLGIPLARIPVRPEAVQRWRTDNGTNYYDFLEPAMREYGYEMPGGNSHRPGVVRKAEAAPPFAFHPKADSADPEKDTGGQSRSGRCSPYNGFGIVGRERPKGFPPQAS